jgi:hypothetical protein
MSQRVQELFPGSLPETEEDAQMGVSNDAGGGEGPEEFGAVQEAFLQQRCLVGRDGGMVAAENTGGELRTRIWLLGGLRTWRRWPGR